MTVVLASVVFAQNARYNKDIDPGYDMSSLLNVKMPEEQSTELFRNELREYPGIISMSGCAGNGVGLTTGASEVTYGGRQYEIVTYYVSSNYLETLQFHLKEGRSFDTRTPDDSLNGIVVNESFVRELGLTSAVNLSVPVYSRPHTIIGVVEDFLTSGTTHRIKPCMFTVNQWSAERALVMRVEPSSRKAVIAKVEAVWKRLYPDFPCETSWQAETTSWGVEFSGTMLKLNSILSILAILIGAMGLIALVASNIARRTKEVGIRKVVGAETSQIVVLINRELIIVVAAAVLIADTGGYWIVTMFLDSIWYYHVSVDATALLSANALVAIVAALTVSWQVWKAARANPVDSLKYE